MVTLNGGTPSAPTSAQPIPTPEIPDDFAAALNRRFASEIPVGSNAAQDDPPTYEDAQDSPGPDDTDDGTDSRTGGADADGGGEGAAPSPATATFRVPINGQEYDLTVAQIEGMVALANWAQSLDPQVAQQMSAIEAGAAVTISRDEYLRYQQMQAQPQTATPAEPDLSYLDADAQQYINSLKQQAAEAAAERSRGVGAQPPQVDPRAVAWEQQQMQQMQDRAANDYMQATVQWQQQHGFSDDEVGQLVQSALSLNAFGLLAEQERVYAPDGTLVRDANMYSVTERALNYALSNRPDLFTKATQPSASSSSQSDIDRAVSQKKANAASLAAAPSAAIPTPTSDPRSMPQQQLVNEMANAIRNMEGIG